jgi:hypothetical protein
MIVEWKLLSDLADTTAKLLELVRQRKIEADERAAEYFATLGNALEGIATKLRDGKIPRVEGTKYNQLVFQFDDCTSKVRDSLGKARYAMLRDLKQLGVYAKNLDWHHLNSDKSLAPYREHWLAEIERGAGHLQALGTTLRSRPK